MKSTHRIAKEIGISQDMIEKRLNTEFTRQFKDHMEEIDGKIYFDAEVEELLRLMFQKNGKPDTIAGEWYAAAPPDGAPVVAPASAQINAEITAATDGESPEEIKTKEEAALAKAPMLPALHWSQLPVVRAINMPLNYSPELLVQAVDAQRREINEYLNQFDRLVDQLTPDWGKGGLSAVNHGKRALRLVGTTAGR